MMRAIVMILLGSVAMPVVATAESPDDLLIIANKSVSARSASGAELRLYFLKKRQQWKSGGSVVPINARDSPALRRAFRSKVLQMSADAEKKYWQDQKIKSGMQKPAEMKNTIKAVFFVKGSVSYTFRKQLKRGLVKVLAVF